MHPTRNGISGHGGLRPTSQCRWFLATASGARVVQSSARWACVTHDTCHKSAPLLRVSYSRCPWFQRGNVRGFNMKRLKRCSTSAHQHIKHGDQHIAETRARIERQRALMQTTIYIEQPRAHAASALSDLEHTLRAWEKHRNAIEHFVTTRRSRPRRA